MSLCVQVGVEFQRPGLVADVSVGSRSGAAAVQSVISGDSRAVQHGKDRCTFFGCERRLCLLIGTDRRHRRPRFVDSTTTALFSEPLRVKPDLWPSARAARNSKVGVGTGGGLSLLAGTISTQQDDRYGDYSDQNSSGEDGSKDDGQ